MPENAIQITTRCISTKISEKGRTWENITSPSSRQLSKEVTFNVKSSSNKFATGRHHSAVKASTITTPISRSKVLKWVNPPSRNGTLRDGSLTIEDCVNRAVSNGVIIQDVDNDLSWESLCNILLGFIENGENRTGRSTNRSRSRFKTSQLRSNQKQGTEIRRARSFSEPGYKEKELPSPHSTSHYKPLLANSRMVRDSNPKVQNLEKVNKEMEEQLEEYKKRESELRRALEILAKQKRELENNLKETRSENIALKEIMSLQKLSD